MKDTLTGYLSGAKKMTVVTAVLSAAAILIVLTQNKPLAASYSAGTETLFTIYAEALADVDGKTDYELAEMFADMCHDHGISCSVRARVSQATGKTCTYNVAWEYDKDEGAVCLAIDLSRKFIGPEDAYAQIMELGSVRYPWFF